MPEKSLIKEPDKVEIESVKKLLKNPAMEEHLENHIKEFLSLQGIKNKTDKQKKDYDNIQTKMAYMSALDYGTFIQIIPRSEQERDGLMVIRHRIVREYECKTAAELMLADLMAAAYWRVMKYEFYATRLSSKENGGWSFDQLTVNVLKEVRSQIEQGRRQIEQCVIQLQNLKQPQLKVNVKAESAYFAQNQQVINGKPQNEPPVETIKPK